MSMPHTWHKSRTKSDCELRRGLNGSSFFTLSGIGILCAVVEALFCKPLFLLRRLRYVYTFESENTLVSRTVILHSYCIRSLLYKLKFAELI